jgi:hypothetical protein
MKTKLIFYVLDVVVPSASLLANTILTFKMSRTNTAVFGLFIIGEGGKMFYDIDTWYSTFSGVIGFIQLM